MLVYRLARGAVVLALVVLATIFGVRAWDAMSGPALGPWHTYVPDEAGPDEIAAMNWADWLAREEAVFAEVRANVTGQLAAGERVPENRYFAQSPLHPDTFATNWNRSFLVEPAGAPQGSVVLLHGLTDAPYSLRHIADLYLARGFVVVGIRLPGHGTVPAGLTRAGAADWRAASRLAARVAAERAPGLPLHVVGYSMGGALATLYAAEALGDDALVTPDRVVLISPMIGVSRFARFAGLAAMPAVLPGFVRAAWLGIVPEFNPFKYNSFPVNAGRQSFLLTRDLQDALGAAERAGRLASMPPVLTFQSVADFTVSTRAVVEQLFGRLPANGSELVLFDLNRAAYFQPLISPASDAELARIMPPPPRAYAATVITNAGPGDRTAVERRLAAGAAAEEVRPLGTAFPPDVFSLSHIALPFPPTDGLYGGDPDPSEDFGIRIGTLAAKGEFGVLIIGLDTFARASFNPFHDFMLDRIGGAIP